MNRRDILKLAATSAAVPAVGIAQQPVGKLAPSWAPSFFDAHQFQTVAVLVDLIIPVTDTPGAIAAQVDRHIDHLLAASPEDEKQAFREGLGWLDGYAIRTQGKPFVRCARDVQVSILETLDASIASEAPNLAPGHRFFQLAKRLTAELFYATEIGFNELNQGGRVPATFGCPHPEHP
jgi:hypothetical protein